MRSRIRKQWLKSFFRSHSSKKEWKKYDEVDTWSDSTVDAIIADIANDLRQQLRETPVNDFDEDFIEYLNEMGYEDETLTAGELAIEYVEWAKEAVLA